MRTFLIVCAGLAGPAGRAAALPAGRPLLILALASAAIAAAGVLRERRHLLRLVVAAAAAAGVVAGEGWFQGAWVGVVLVLVDWTGRRWEPIPGAGRPGTEATPAVAVLLIVGAWRCQDTDAGWWPFAFAAAALGATMLSARFPGRLGGVAGRVGHVAGRVVGTACFAVLAVPAVLVPWVFQRVAFVEPRGMARVGGWRGDGPTRTASSGGRESRAIRRSRAETLRVTAVALLATIAVLVAFDVDLPSRATAPQAGFVLSGERPSGGAWWEEPDTTPAAYRGAAWYPSYRQDIEWLTNQGVAFRPIHRDRVLDVTTRTVNVRDGVRVTWAPPECGCHRLTVWIYGGSTTFGIGQRDLHTIPSELARRAWESGIALDVVNRGVPGDLHWEEAGRLAWDLAESPPPDLVLFYDGVNELWATQELASSGQGDPNRPAEPLVDQVWRGVLDNTDSNPPPTPPGAEVVPTTSVDRPAPAVLGRLATERYERSLLASRALVEATGVEAAWFWQPSRLSRPAVEGEPGGGDGDDDTRELTDAAAAALPAGVVDLSDVFDEHPGPLFSDDVHHNEVGAALVAAAIYDEIAPVLRSLLDA